VPPSERAISACGRLRLSSALGPELFSGSQRRCDREIHAQGESVLATRKPLLWKWTPGRSQARMAARRALGLSIQDPPRRTR
jgi:hypothetical protein